jgi:hypothetical protein
MRIVADAALDEELRRVRQVEEIEAGARRFPYPQLDPGDFELLVYLLFHDGLTRQDFYESATLAIAGADKGRDILLLRNERPVGVVQCKGRSTRIDGKAALREAVKFLLHAFDDPDFDGGFDGFHYILAVATDPATTTVDLFGAPGRSIERHQADLEQAIRSLASKYRSLANIDFAAVLPKVEAGLRAMVYTLLRPEKLDGYLLAAPETFRQRFFRSRLVIADIDVVRALVLGGIGAAVASPLRTLEPEQRRRLAADLAALMAERMSRAGIYKRGRTIARDAFELEFQRFLGSHVSIFPVIGMSGVGKSSAMAELAERDDSGLPPRLLVRGTDIANGHGSIADLLELLPWAEAGCKLPPGQAVQALSSSSNEPLLLILDGLNEAGMDPPLIRTRWLPNTLDWLSRRNVKLLLSCRPELWSSLEMAIPTALLHLPPPQKPSPEEPVEPFLARPPKVFGLGDFTRSEAAEALRAYGFADRLEIDQATHPFILFVLDALGPETDLRHLGLSEILETLIATKVTRALERLGQSTWQAHVMTCLMAMASDMNRRHTQVILTQVLEEHFGRYLQAADSLAEEHILSPTKEGYRFQHDQVREFLQARPLTVEALEGFVPRLPPPLRTPQRSVWRYMRYDAQLKIELRRSRFGELTPSVAALAAARALSAQSNQIIPLLEAIWEATSIEADAVVRSWARQLILALLSFAPGAALSNPDFLGWFGRLLEQDRYPEYHGWTEQLSMATVGFLARCAAPFETKAAFLTAVILRESDFDWRRRGLASDAFWERYGDGGGEEDRHHRSNDTPAAQLVSHLLSIDPTGTISILGSLLDDDRLLPLTPSVGQRRAPLSVGHCAKICLFDLRRDWLEPTVEAALSSTSAEGGELIEGLASGNPDELMAACLKGLADESTANPHQLQRALWLAASSGFLASDESLLYALRGLHGEHGDGLHIVWSARIFFERLKRHKSLCRADPSLEYSCRLVEDIKPLAGSAAMYLRAHLAANAESEHLSEDYLYLLEEDFEAGLRILETQLKSNEGLRPLAFSAVTQFITQLGIDEPGRRTRYADLVALLDRYVDQHGETAVAMIAKFVIYQARHAGLNKEYYVTANDIRSLGLLALAKRLIALGGETVSRECSSMFFPKDRSIRKELLSAVRTADLAPEHVRDLVYSLCVGQPFAGRTSAAYLISLRTAGREAAWDRGAQQYLFHGSGLGPRGLNEQIIQFWKRLPKDRLTQLSAAILSRVQEGKDIRDAADPVALRAFMDDAGRDKSSTRKARRFWALPWRRFPT